MVISYEKDEERKLEIISDALVIKATFMGWPLDKCQFRPIDDSTYFVRMGSRRLDCIGINT
jgi:hypothetical protein